jgi:hypothetical protein
VDRIFDCGSNGRRFDSSQAHQVIKMANFSFYFTLNKINENKEKSILELIIGSVGFQGLTSFPIP